MPPKDLGVRLLNFSTICWPWLRRHVCGGIDMSHELFGAARVAIQTR
jgi:hypothetical protein